MDRTRRVIPQEDRPVPYKVRIRTKTGRPSLYELAYNTLAELFGVDSRIVDAWIAAVPSFARPFARGRHPTSRATGRS